MSEGSLEFLAALDSSNGFPFLQAGPPSYDFARP